MAWNHIAPRTLTPLSTFDERDVREGWRGSYSHTGFPRYRNPNAHAQDMGPDCIIVAPCEEQDALVLSQLFYELCGDMRDACWYNGAVLSMYCGHTVDRRSLREKIRAMVHGYYAALKRRR